MPVEPADKRAVAFVDGQNLYYAAREAFGYTYPNYDPVALARKICDVQSWRLAQTRFYTGVPDNRDNAFWHHFWTAKMAVMGTRGVRVFSRALRYSNKEVRLPDGATVTTLVGREKGVDVRLALDAVRLALDDKYDVALFLSQDQDLSEAADDIREIARQRDRWIEVACAYPASPASRNARGINETDWIKIDRATYDACLDPNDYRPKADKP